MQTRCCSAPHKPILTNCRGSRTLWPSSLISTTLIRRTPNLTFTLVFLRVQYWDHRFLIYLNNIVDNIVSDIFLFADDTSLLNISDSWDLVQTQLNSDLLKLHDCSVKWLISFNATKTEFMLFSSQPVLNVPVKLKLNDAVLISIETHKHLGLVLHGLIMLIVFVCKFV